MRSKTSASAAVRTPLRNRRNKKRRYLVKQFPSLNDGCWKHPPSQFQQQQQQQQENEEQTHRAFTRDSISANAPITESMTTTSLTSMVSNANDKTDHWRHLPRRVSSLLDDNNILDTTPTTADWDSTNENYTISDASHPVSSILFQEMTTTSASNISISSSSSSLLSVMDDSAKISATLLLRHRASHTDDDELLMFSATARTSHNITCPDEQDVAVDGKFPIADCDPVKMHQEHPKSGLLRRRSRRSCRATDDHGIVAPASSSSLLYSKQESEPCCHADNDGGRGAMSGSHVATTTSMPNQIELDDDDDDDVNIVVVDVAEAASSNVVAAPCPTTSGSHVPPSLPMEIWREVCFFVNDPRTLCRLSCVSKDLHQLVAQKTIAPVLWKGLYQRRWIRSSSPSSLSSTTTATATSSPMMMLAEDLMLPSYNDDDDDFQDKEVATLTAAATSDSSWNNSCDSLFRTTEHSLSYYYCYWKTQFQRRFAYEGYVIRTIQDVVLTELEPNLIKCDDSFFDLLHQRMQNNGQTASMGIDHEGWRHVVGGLQPLHPQPDDDDDISPPLDVLCAMANVDMDYHPALERGVMSAIQQEQQHSSTKSSYTWTHDPKRQQAQRRRLALLRFAAASSTFTLHCQEVVTEMTRIWERSLYQQVMMMTTTSTPTTSSTTSLLSVYEETAVLLSHALRTVPNMLQRSSSLSQLQVLVSQQLDQMACTVQRHLDYYLDNKLRQQQQLLLRCDSTYNLQNNMPCHGCDLRELLFTLHFVLSKLYHIQSHVPSEEDDDEQLIRCCSIAHALLDIEDSNQQSQQPHQNGHNPQKRKLCHPILVAIIYQAVARRLVGCVNCDILFGPEHQHTLLRFTSTIPTLSSSSSSSTTLLLFMDLVQDPGRIMTLGQCQELIRQCHLLTEQDYSERSIRSPNHRRQVLVPTSSSSSSFASASMASSGDVLGEVQDEDVIDLHGGGGGGDHHLLHHHEDPMDEDVRTAFWSQPSMSVSSVVYWLSAPFLAKHGRRRRQRKSRQQQHQQAKCGDDTESHIGGSHTGPGKDTLNNNNNNNSNEGVDAVDDKDADDEGDQPFDFLLGQMVESSFGGDGDGEGRLVSYLQNRMVFFPSMMRHCNLIS